MIIGAGIVMTIAFVTVISLWMITKNSALGWIFSHLVTLSIGIFLWLSIVKPNEVAVGYLSEYTSGRIGIAGILWTISMGCMLRGVWGLSQIGLVQKRIQRMRKITQRIKGSK